MMMTRTTHTGEPLTYAAIGASQAPDLLYYPPKGYRPAEDRMRLGSGTERFQTAAATLLSWGVQRGSGIEVQNIELPVPSDTDYVGLVYDEAGLPIAPREPGSDQTYSEDGTPQVISGLTAELRIPALGRHFIAPIRVVLVVDEHTKAGFAYGTLAGHPEEGEASFMVTHEPDDSVWLTVRSFSRPSKWQYRLAAPVLHSLQRSMTKRYLRALLPGRTK